MIDQLCDEQLLIAQMVRSARRRGDFAMVSQYMRCWRWLSIRGERGTGMIWNDRRIRKWAETGGVTPYAEDLVKPASLDLRLGNKIRFPLRKWETKSCEAITMKTPPDELWGDEIVIGSYGIVIPSGGVALCCSLEYITMPPDASGTLMSRSGTGRRLFEHLHSGFFEPDFHGNATFEFINDGPWDMRLFVGDALVQLKLEQMIELPVKSYLVTGHYNGQTGATPHRGTP